MLGSVMMLRLSRIGTEVPLNKAAINRNAASNNWRKDIPGKTPRRATEPDSVFDIQ